MREFFQCEKCGNIVYNDESLSDFLCQSCVDEAIKEWQKQIILVEAQKKTKVYLASPYRHKDPEVVERRYRDVRALAAKYINEGWIIYSPIVYSHHLAKEHSMPDDWLFWEAYDTNFIRWADELWVATLDGWQESEGVQAEIRIAKSLGIPIKYV